MPSFKFAAPPHPPTHFYLIFCKPVCTLRGSITRGVSVPASQKRRLHYQLSLFFLTFFFLCIQCHPLCPFWYCRLHVQLTCILSQYFPGTISFFFFFFELVFNTKECCQQPVQTHSKKKERKKEKTTIYVKIRFYLFPSQFLHIFVFVFFF